MSSAPPSAGSSRFERRLAEPADDRPFDSLAEVSFHPVVGGEHRVLHLAGSGTGGRPVVFVPGWGASIAGWQDFFGLLQGEVELYVIETLEKSTTRIDRGPHDRTVLQTARNVASTIESLGLGDYALFGACWGGAILLEGLIEGLFEEAPVVLAYDPMHSMWFSPLFLKGVASWLPLVCIEAVRAPLSYFAIRGLDQPVQRERTKAFIADADVWRWRAYSVAAADFELYGRLSKVSREVLVVNGANDAIHDRSQYPKVARELPKGRMFYREVDESQRERFAAVVAEALAGSSGSAVPELLLEMEQDLRRESAGSSR